MSNLATLIDDPSILATLRQTVEDCWTEYYYFFMIACYHSPWSSEEIAYLLRKIAVLSENDVLQVYLVLRLSGE